MPTRAFLLSNDEKALDAITQILGELEVSFEIFHEPSFAAKRVASQHFDLILVDCDHEQNACEVFTAVKKSGVNQTSIGIAVVDGKNGVASAFRLGATLVLAKPVSMEQARGTLRNALAMVRKSTPEGKLAATVHGSTSSLAPAKADGHGSQVATTPPTLPAPKPATATPLRAAAEVPPLPVSEPGVAAPKVSESAPKSKFARATLGPTDKLPLAKEASTPSKPSKSLSLTGNEPSSGTSKHPAPPTLGMTAQENPQRRISPVVLAVVAIALIAAGVYAYSMVNPGFHSLLLSEFRNLQSRTGLGPKPHPVAAIPKPVPAPPVAATPTAQPAATASANANAGDTAAAASPMPDGFAAPQPAPSQAAQSSAPTKSGAPLILNTAATVQKPAADDEPLVVPEDVADSHVAYRVQPVYPQAARRKGLKGSVVLNASVDKDGNVAAVEVASGNAQLASAAVAAVKQWRYEAYYHNGQPSEFETQVTVRFPQPAPR